MNPLVAKYSPIQHNHALDFLLFTLLLYLTEPLSLLGKSFRQPVLLIGIQCSPSSSSCLPGARIVEAEEPL